MNNLETGNGTQEPLDPNVGTDRETEAETLGTVTETDIYLSNNEWIPLILFIIAVTISASVFETYDVFLHQYVFRTKKMTLGQRFVSSLLAVIFFYILLKYILEIPFIAILGA